MSKVVFVSGQADERTHTAACAGLVRKGFKAINARSVDLRLVKDGIDGYEINRLRLSILANCDILYLLQGWQNSKQCELELAYARQTGKQVIYQAYSLRRVKQYGAESVDSNGEQCEVSRENGVHKQEPFVEDGGVS